MYTLTLSAGERKAIDMMGSAYSHGNDLYLLLWAQSEQTPDDADWDDPRDIVFEIPEHVAWAIRDMGEECEYRWDNFAPEFAAKLTDFCMEIV